MTARVTHNSNRTWLGRGLRRSSSGGGGSRGFTLIELLVVISIIVLILALAVPLIGSLRGGRSVDAGENIASAMLQRARSRAIGIQQRRGVFFFDDAKTGKTGMLLVKLLDASPNLVLELEDDSEEIEYLPNGIGVAGLLPNNAATDFRPSALIVFDGIGRVETVDRYRVSPPSPGTTTLGLKYMKSFKDNVWTNIGSAQAEPSQAAFVLYDRRNLADQPPQTSSTLLDVQFSPEQLTWLDQNALAVVVNRYNGTLIRGE
jgi:prepilin-type N-terminal cleavage/methylation domain-containing protein